MLFFLKRRRRKYKKSLPSSCFDPLLLPTITRGHTWTSRPLFLTLSGLLWHMHTSSHTQTHALTHRGLRHSLSHRATPPLFWKSTITIHSAKSTHTTSCLLGYTSSTHTRSCLHTYTHTDLCIHTSQRAPSPYCLSIWLVPFVSHFLSA